MTSTASMCQNLSSKVKTLSDQALNNYDTQGAGSNCDKQTSGGGGGGMPDMPNGDNNNQNPNNPNNQANTNSDPYGCQSNPTSQVCQNCTLNPNSPTCQALAQSQQQPTGKIGFQAPDKSGADPSSFNVGDTATGSQTQFPVANNQNGQQAPQGAVVPNNSGGAIPGSDGGSKPAGLDQPKRQAGAPIGSAADIEHGLSSGGGGGGFSYGSGLPNDANTAANTRGGGGRGPASLKGGGMDLKKYLPGQQLDPHRMGGNGMIAADINGPACDIFKKISTRILVKCKVGDLYDCRQ